MYLRDTDFLNDTSECLMLLAHLLIDLNIVLSLTLLEREASFRLNNSKDFNEYQKK